MINKINVFLPCRKGSKRILHKNTKKFSNFNLGLFEIKFNQIIKIKYLDKVYVSTNDHKIINYLKKKRSNKIVIIKRDKKLADDSASTDDLIKHVSKIINSGNILWTHVSSPFINTENYNKIVKKYFLELNKGCDSLMTVSAIQTFLWNKKKALNYNRKIEKWPRTQTIKKLYEINSGVFIASSKIYKKLNDRIGKKPYLYELDKLVGFDIDWPNDFKLAEQLIKSKIAKL